MLCCASCRDLVVGLARLAFRITLERRELAKDTPPTLPEIEPTIGPVENIAIGSGSYLLGCRRWAAPSLGGLGTNQAETFLAFLQGAKSGDGFGSEREVACAG